MNLDDSTIVRLIKRRKDERERLAAMEQNLSDTAHQLRKLSEALRNDLDAIQVASSEDALFLDDVRIPYDALKALGKELTELDDLRRQHSDTCLTLSNQGFE